MGTNDGNKVEGEGSYSGARQYDEAVTRHAKNEQAVKAEAEAAKKAVEGSEGAALEKAEAEGKSHARG